MERDSSSSELVLFAFQLVLRLRYHLHPSDAGRNVEGSLTCDNAFDSVKFPAPSETYRLSRVRQQNDISTAMTWWRRWIDLHLGVELLDMDAIGVSTWRHCGRQTVTSCRSGQLANWPAIRYSQYILWKALRCDSWTFLVGFLEKTKAFFQLMIFTLETNKMTLVTRLPKHTHIKITQLLQIALFHFLFVLIYADSYSVYDPLYIPHSDLNCYAVQQTEQTFKLQTSSSHAMQ